MDTRLIAQEKQMENWLSIINECKNSGMKVKDWLIENNISRDQYYYWYRRIKKKACEEIAIKKETQKNEIVKIECESPISATSDKFITLKTANINIDIPCNASADVIKTVLEVAVNAK